MSKFHWSEDVIANFQFESHYLPQRTVRENIRKFVEADCTPEDGETYEELARDLSSAVYTK